MDKIIVDFSKEYGKPKPMHCTNNGPVYKFAADQRVSNLQAFIDAGIPYARNHDASFCSAYGLNHTVDVDFIFTDWSKDPYDPASYDFACTDEYIRVHKVAGTKVFYRLGSRIEHQIKKYNTRVPVDFDKWAVVCEHIIRHYNEGWADGMYENIEYWEIWNEPDLDPDDSKNKRCWQGTAKQFYELFNVALTHLKKCFPHLKIGGPAVAGAKNEKWLRGFFESLGEVKPDFFSWHRYTNLLEKFILDTRNVRKLLDEYGLQNVESINNEWNYVKGWVGDEWIYSLATEKNIKGSSFIASVMCAMSYEPLDMLMYYDARPGGMNGMFCTDRIYEKLKGYYPFYMYNQLYKQDKIVSIERESQDVWAVGAKGNEKAVMISYYNDDDSLPSKEVKVEFKNVENKNGVKLEYYLLDETHDCSLVREEIFTANEFASYINMSLHSTYLLKIINL